MANKIASSNAKSRQSKLDGWSNIFFDISLNEIFIFPHRELRSDQVTSDEEGVTEHLNEAGRVSQGGLFLVSG